MFRVNNRNARKRCEICSELTIKTPEWRRRLAGDYIINFEHISHLFLMFLLLTFSKKMLAGFVLTTNIFRTQSNIRDRVFAKVNNFFAKSSFLVIWVGSEYASCQTVFDSWPPNFEKIVLKTNALTSWLILEAANLRCSIK